jgi:ribonuclease HI
MHGTNNEAEYKGLLLGLQAAVELGVKELLVQGDSQLVIEQMKGNWKVKAENLLMLKHECKLLCQKFATITFTHIPRERNAIADELTKEALIFKHDKLQICSKTEI